MFLFAIVLGSVLLFLLLGLAFLFVVRFELRRRYAECRRRGYHTMGLNGACRHCGREML